MGDIETLRALEARVGAASGADRELDLLLWHDVQGERRPRPGFQINMGAVPKFTASIDAAVALVERVEPDLEWLVRPDRILGGFANLYDPDRSPNEGHPCWSAHAATPALALCAALLSALIARAEHEGSRTAAGEVP